jgi:hypothetical protein
LETKADGLCSAAAKSREVKTEFNLTESSKEDYWFKRGCFSNDVDDL